MFPTVKALFALWLYYPEVEGISTIENMVGPHLDTAFLKVNHMIGGFMAKKIGIQNKETSGPSRRVA